MAGAWPYVALLAHFWLANEVMSLSKKLADDECSIVAQMGKEIPRKAMYRPDGKRFFGKPGEDSYPVQKKHCKAYANNSPVNLTGLPRDCADILARGMNISGIYDIYPGGKGNPFNVFCDMETYGGGWTVFQRRKDGSVEFNRRWFDYKHGFGSISSEHWLGNDKIHRLTSQRVYELLIDLESFHEGTNYARYGRFEVGNESGGYTLTVIGYSGRAGNSFQHHFGLQFSTPNHDIDRFETRNCASEYEAGWWFGSCFRCNLNGLYFPEGEAIVNDRHEGVIWFDWLGFSHSLKFTEMKIRPV